MEFGLWERYYKEILDDFGFSRSDDENSAKVLDEILSEEGCLTLDDLAQIVGFSDKYIVFGAGPSLKEHIIQLKENYHLKDYVLISADGATTALIEERLSPDIVATDLDGNLDDILLANIYSIFQQCIGDYSSTACRKCLQLWRIYRWGQSHIFGSGIGGQ